MKKLLKYRNWILFIASLSIFLIRGIVQWRWLTTLNAIFIWAWYLSFCHSLFNLKDDLFGKLRNRSPFHWGKYRKPNLYEWTKIFLNKETTFDKEISSMEKDKLIVKQLMERDINDLELGLYLLKENVSFNVLNFAIALSPLFLGHLQPYFLANVPDLTLIILYLMSLMYLWMIYMEEREKSYYKHLTKIAINKKVS